MGGNGILVVAVIRLLDLKIRNDIYENKLFVRSVNYDRSVGMGKREDVRLVDKKTSIDEFEDRGIWHLSWWEFLPYTLRLINLRVLFFFLDICNGNDKMVRGWILHCPFTRTLV